MAARWICGMVVFRFVVLGGATRIGDEDDVEKHLERVPVESSPEVAAMEGELEVITKQLQTQEASAARYQGELRSAEQALQRAKSTFESAKRTFEDVQLGVAELRSKKNEKNAELQRLKARVLNQTDFTGLYICDTDAGLMKLEQRGFSITVSKPTPGFQDLHGEVNGLNIVINDTKLGGQGVLDEAEGWGVITWKSGVRWTREIDFSGTYRASDDNQEIYIEQHGLHLVVTKPSEPGWRPQAGIVGNTITVAGRDMNRQGRGHLKDGVITWGNQATWTRIGPVPTPAPTPVPTPMPTPVPTYHEDMRIFPKSNWWFSSCTKYGTGAFVVRTKANHAGPLVVKIKGGYCACIPNERLYANKNNSCPFCCDRDDDESYCNVVKLQELITSGKC